jgi:hypothetical protein
MEQIVEIESLYEQTEAGQSEIGAGDARMGSIMSKMSVKTAKTFVYSDKLGNDSQALPEEESISSSDEEAVKS